MSLKNFLKEKIPQGVYSDGTKSTCIIYNIFSAIDPLKSLDAKVINSVDKKDN